MNDNTRIRIKVPAHLYEAVKKQLMIKEGNDFGMPGSTTVKVKNTPSEPKSAGVKIPTATNAGAGEEPTEKTLEERITELEAVVKSLKKSIHVKDEEDETEEEEEEDETEEEEEEDEAKKPVKKEAKEEEEEEDEAKKPVKKEVEDIKKKK